MEKQDHFPKKRYQFSSKPQDYFSYNNIEEHSGISTENYGQPSMYKVWLINDDNIPSDMFMTILREFFHLLKHDSVSYFVKLRNDGYINYGYYTREIADEKVNNINAFGKIHGYIVKCLSCKDDGHVIKES